MNASLARELWNYDPETGEFTWRVKPAKNIEAGARTGSPDSDGYLQLCYRGKKYKAHRVAWLLMTGSLPSPSIEIDHRDRDPANNRFNNLRLATKKQNAENVRSRREGFFRGVYWFERTEKWVVFGKQQGRQKNLGYFANLIDAVAARIRFERAFYTHSEFCQ